LSAIEGVKGILFDCYDTLIVVEIDEESLQTFGEVAEWLHYQGVRIEPEILKKEYHSRIREQMDLSGELYPEVKLEEIFGEICHDFRIWDIDEASLGIATARTFRAASLRNLSVMERTVRLLDFLAPLRKGVVSNGQRVFSEIELRYFNLLRHFEFVLFSSDLGIKKPDYRVFRSALDRLGTLPEETLLIGNSEEEDLTPAAEIGLQTMHIRDAWEIPNQ
jgi:putative hydrolase of the HAD superfamily